MSNFELRDGGEGGDDDGDDLLDIGDRAAVLVLHGHLIAALGLVYRSYNHDQSAARSIAASLLERLRARAASHLATKLSAHDISEPAFGQALDDIVRDLLRRAAELGAAKMTRALCGTDGSALCRSVGPWLGGATLAAGEVRGIAAHVGIGAEVWVALGRGAFLRTPLLVNELDPGVEPAIELDVSAVPLCMQGLAIEHVRERLAPDLVVLGTVPLRLSVRDELMVCHAVDPENVLDATGTAVSYDLEGQR